MREPLLPTRSRERIAADVREELEGWIEERATELEASGLSPDAARRQALAEFGNTEGARRYAERQDIVADLGVRALQWLEEMVADLRIAARTLRRTPIVSGVILLTFALGIGTTTAIFSVVHAMLLRPLPYGPEETLVFLAPVQDGTVDTKGRLSAAALVALRERTTSFRGIASLEFGNDILADGGDPELVTSAVVTDNVTNVLVAPAIGRGFFSGQAADGMPPVILTNHLWRRRFAADSSVIGRTITLSARRYSVIGVMPQDFRVPTREDAEVLYLRNIDNWRRMPNVFQQRYLRLVARLKPDVSAMAAQAEVDRVMQSLPQEFPKMTGLGARVTPVREVVAGDVRPRLLLLMGAAGFALLIVCANIAGVLLVRAIARRHELSIRVALGAGRRRLVRHFLSEGLVLAVLGIVIGLFVAQLGVGVLRQIAETTLPPGTSFALEPRVLAFAIMIAAIGALAASVAPALAGTRVAAPTLRHDVARMSTTRAGRQLRLALVAGQLALAMVLLVGTGLFLRSLQRLDALELGYSTANALTFRAQFPQGPKYATDAYEDAFWSSLHEQLSALPGVVSVGFGNTPVSGSFGSSVESEDPSIATDRLPPVRWTAVSDDYFTTLGIRVRKGRTFAPSDKTGSPPVVVISRELAEKLAPGGDPIGSRIRLGPNHPLGWATVVGIVSDVRLRSTNATQPSVYTTQRQDHWHGGSRVVLRTLGDPRRLAEPVRAVMRRVEPAVPVAEMETLEKVQRTTPAIAERRIVMQLLLAFAVIGLVVSAIGVYGVGAYAMESRRREFGIRVALGATQRRVLWLALRDGIVVALLGILAGIPVAWLAGFRVRGLLYEVEPMEPATLGAVVILLTLVALIASVVPAKRASRVDPAATMRTD